MHLKNEVGGWIGRPSKWSRSAVRRARAVAAAGRARFSIFDRHVCLCRKDGEGNAVPVRTARIIYFSHHAGLAAPCLVDHPVTPRHEGAFAATAPQKAAVSFLPRRSSVQWRNLSKRNRIPQGDGSALHRE